MHLIVGPVERIESLGLGVVVVQDVDVVFHGGKLAGGRRRYRDLLGPIITLFSEGGSLHAIPSDVATPS